jgi:benzoate membrane transport protein
LLNIKFSHISAGFIAVLVGYTSSVAIIFQAANALNANQEQLNSWMLVLGCGMGFTSIVLSAAYKMPVITAWSTPGAALLATSLIGVSMEQAVAGFILTGLLILACGLTGWFAMIQRLIPNSIANAMLAGILFQVCSATFEALQQEFSLVLLMLLSYLFAKPVLKNYTVPVVFLIGIVFSWQQGLFIDQPIELTLAKPVWINPDFTLSAFISISIPLFIVTMTSQNVPGIATLQAAGFNPPVSPSLIVTGLATTVLGAMGGFSYNLAAITAAICCTQEVDPNKNTRYIAGIMTGVFYLIIGLFGATVVSLFLVAPKALLVTIAGLALLNTLANSLNAALTAEQDREAALLTLLVTVSGVSFFSIGSAFWGLLLGMMFLYVRKYQAQTALNDSEKVNSKTVKNSS